MSSKSAKKVSPVLPSPNANPNRSDYLSKENEYKRLNDELERRTASLVKEAEAVMNQQESVSLRMQPSRTLLDNINSEEFLHDVSDEGASLLLVSNSPKHQPTVTSKKTLYKPSSSRPPTSSKRPTTTILNRSASIDSASAPELQSAIADLQKQSDLHSDDEVPDDILPQAAQQMGSDAQIRFLKAKARVMQEEMDRLSSELTHEKEENNKLMNRAKLFEEEQNKMIKINAAQQQQLDKLKKSAEDARKRADSLDAELMAVNKELDSLKRMQKQQATVQGAADVRLNRALEEAEKYKQQLAMTKEADKNVLEQDKKRIEKLLVENKKLEKQKSELMTGFKKQLKLIDILKRQKMHIEAAKMLSFTEEEFVKALEWGN